MNFYLRPLFILVFLFSCSKSGDNASTISNQEVLSDKETLSYNFLKNHQLPSGLLKSNETNGLISLYDNAIAAMVFTAKEDYTRAHKIFDVFNSRIEELAADSNGPRGFYQFRNEDGGPTLGTRRWLGDNAWLLISINYYKAVTGNSTYDTLANAISRYIKSLQDTDGGLFFGFEADSSFRDTKVTEGNIDAFNALPGYTETHANILKFLKNKKWSNGELYSYDVGLDAKYEHALDIHPWAYSAFKNYPIKALTTSVERFKTTITNANGITATGFCFDTDKNNIWLEGTGQMAVALGTAGLTEKRDFYLKEIEKSFIMSNKYSNSGGIPYVSNSGGDAYESAPLWPEAHAEVSISGTAWYLFAKMDIDPLAIGRKQHTPEEDMFWLENQD